LRQATVVVAVMVSSLVRLMRSLSLLSLSSSPVDALWMAGMLPSDSLSIAPVSRPVRANKSTAGRLPAHEAWPSKGHPGRLRSNLNWLCRQGRVDAAGQPTPAQPAEACPWRCQTRTTRVGSALCWQPRATAKASACCCIARACPYRIPPPLQCTKLVVLPTHKLRASQHFRNKLPSACHTCPGHPRHSIAVAACVARWRQLRGRHLAAVAACVATWRQLRGVGCSCRPGRLRSGWHVWVGRQQHLHRALLGGFGAREGHVLPHSAAHLWP
jgi:hypothetical protein